MTIASDGNAFQRASFRECRLEGATLQGGDSSFQIARFDAAKLARACLKGGGASFQESSFVGTDLAGATLTGGGRLVSKGFVRRRDPDRRQAVGEFPGRQPQRRAV
jgi:uncharacterized protein YjbI with pentapeptide repeats